jgi:hypothetical protein
VSRPRLPRLDRERVSWTGRGTYRILSYETELRWNVEPAGSFADGLLDEFRLPAERAGTHPLDKFGIDVYAFVDAGRSAGRIGRFRLFGGDTLLASSNSAGWMVDRLFWQVNTQALARTCDQLLVHAGSVTTPDGRGVILPAPTGSGKTTLVLGLVRAGFKYMSDEAAVIDPVTRRVFPYARAVGVKKGSFHLFPDLSDGPVPIEDVRYVRLDDAVRAAGPHETAFVVAPLYKPGAAAALTPMTAAETVVVLARNSLNISVWKGRTLLILADALRAARGFRLVYGSLGEAVEMIATLAA